MVIKLCLSYISSIKVRSMLNKKSKKPNLAMLVSNGEMEKVFD